MEDNKIAITVSNPISKKELIGKTTMYTIEGHDDRGAFNVQRKYMDVYALRDMLVLRWPGCYVPMTPEKKLFDTDIKFIQRRIIALNIFLRRLTKFPHLYYSQEMQLFVRSSAKDVDKELRNLPKQLPEELQEKYEKNFFEIMKQPVTLDLQTGITNFTVKIEKISGMLKNFKDMAGNAGKVRRDFEEKFVSLIGQSLPEYEKTCLIEYFGNQEPFFIMENNDQKFADIKSKLKELSQVSNAYDEFQDFINTELEDIRAFQDSIIGQKKNYEQQKERAIKEQSDKSIELQKLKGGKKTLSTLFGNKNDKMSKIELQLEQIKHTIEILGILCNYITVLIGLQEIDHFNESKQGVYYSAIKRVALLEKDHNNIVILDFFYKKYDQMSELWQYLGSNQIIQNAEDIE